MMAIQPEEESRNPKNMNVLYSMLFILTTSTNRVFSLQIKLEKIET